MVWGVQGPSYMYTIPPQVNSENRRILTSTPSPSNKRTIKFHDEANIHKTFPIPLQTRWVLALAALTPVTAMAVDAVRVAYVSSSAFLKPWVPTETKLMHLVALKGDSVSPLLIFKCTNQHVLAWITGKDNGHRVSSNSYEGGRGNRTGY